MAKSFQPGKKCLSKAPRLVESIRHQSSPRKLQAIIEQKQQELLTQYQRDGLTAHVNPADTTQTMVEPSLIGPIFMTVFGLILLVFIIRKHKEILEEAD